MITSLLAGLTLIMQAPPVIAESAGAVHVVHGRLGSQPAAFRVATAPLLTIGSLSVDPAEELTARNPFPVARPLQNGGWAVLDWFALKLYDAGGRHLRTIGRPGRGPGEFGQLRELCVAPGDTLIALGYSDRRLAVFDAEGNHVRTARAEGPVWADPCFPDGSVLIRAGTRPNPRSTLPQARAAVLDLLFEGHRLDWRTGQTSSLGWLPATSRDLQIPDGGNAVVGNGRIHVGNGSLPEFRVYSLSGRLERVVRWQAPAVPATAALPRPDGARPRLPPSPRETLPYYWSLKVDGLGRIWVEDYNREGWSVFDASGAFLGKLAIPALSMGRTEVVWIGTDRVMLASRDADGSPLLTLHALVPR